MKYWLDSEFIDDGRTIDLISIGIICEDGREYYAQSCEFNPQRSNKWVQENVFPHLSNCPYFLSKAPQTNIVKSVSSALHLHKYGQCIPTMNEPERWQCPWRTRTEIAHEIKMFFNPSDGIELYGWCSGYDFVAFCQLFGSMMALPAGWPHYIRDLQHVLDNRSIADELLPEQDGQLHNALADAKHIKRIWQFLETWHSRGVQL